MSDGELRRLEVIQDLDRGWLTTAAAGQLLGLERRQVFRLLKAYRTAGPVGLGLEAPRPAQQPAQTRGAAARGCGDYPPVVRGF
jgi:Winged helix-turn helix